MKQTCVVVGYFSASVETHNSLMFQCLELTQEQQIPPGLIARKLFDGTAMFLVVGYEVNECGSSLCQRWMNSDGTERSIGAMGQ